MARLIGPSEASREVKTIVTTSGSTRGLFKSKALRPATYYVDPDPTATPTPGMLTTLADVRTMAGVAYADSTVTIDAYSMLPEMQFPDGVDSLLVVVDNGPPWRVYAREDDRLDALNTAVLAAQSTASGALVKSANLSDLGGASAARANLGLGSAATKNVGTTSSDVAAGDAPATAQAAAISASVSKGGATKGDGQNPLRLRRPTMVIDKMVPNEQYDHQVVWVDETAKIAYAIGQDRSVRKSTWLTNNDEAISFWLTLSRAPNGKTWAGDGLFVRLPSGALLMSECDVGFGIWTNFKILRSTNDGSSWSTVWTTPDPAVRLLGSQSISQDAVTGYLYLCEYASGATPTSISIWRSTDDGVTWAVWFTLPRAETNAVGVVRHWHGTRWDPISQRVYFSAGDTSPDAGIYRVSADGTTAEAVVKNSQLPAWTTPARTIDFMFFPTHIAWGSDGQDPHLYRMARTEIGSANPVVEQVAETSSTNWWAQNASADGSTWILCSSNEVATNRYDDAVHLYAVTNNGAIIDEVASASMPSGSSAASISGLAAGNGGGVAFWMRAHGYRVHPHTTYSAFQFRARLSWAATPVIVKPTVQRKVYYPETRNWMATLAAGETLTFSHTRAPSLTTLLYIQNMGLKVLSGTGTARLQVYNVTTSTEILTWAGGQNWRRDSTQDTTEFYNRVACAASDQIEFRIIETSGTNSATVSAFVATGWGFPLGT